MPLILSIHIFILLAISSFAQAVKSPQDSDIIFVVSNSSLHNIKPEDAIASMQILTNHIKSLNKLENDITVKLVNNDKDILDNYKNNYDLLLLTIEQYIRLKKIMQLEPYCSNYTNNNYGYVYHLIVNKNENINNINDLKGANIYLQAHSKDQAAFLWLKKLLRDASIKTGEKYFDNVNVDNKATNVLLPVFFRKAKACIITSSSMNLLMELNPGIKDQIKTIYTSEPIILGLTCLNPNKKNENNYKILKEILISLHENEYGKQMLHMFNTDKLILFKEEYLKGYYNLIK